MKRSKSIRLVLLGGVSAGALSGCEPGRPPITSSTVLTNNYYVPGVGYYHAPYRSWYSLPFNHYDTQQKLYFHGGQWTAVPHESITNISAPTVEAAQQAETQRTDVRRGGFGSSSHHHSIWS